jgi:hypothetical protein
MIELNFGKCIYQVIRLEMWDTLQLFQFYILLITCIKFRPSCAL